VATDARHSCGLGVLVGVAEGGGQLMSGSQGAGQPGGVLGGGFMRALGDGGQGGQGPLPGDPAGGDLRAEPVPAPGQQ
jgi:hypothetical protein